MITALIMTATGYVLGRVYRRIRHGVVQSISVQDDRIGRLGEPREDDDELGEVDYEAEATHDTATHEAGGISFSLRWAVALSEDDE